MVNAESRGTHGMKTSVSQKENAKKRASTAQEPGTSGRRCSGRGTPHLWLQGWLFAPSRAGGLSNKPQQQQNGKQYNSHTEKQLLQHMVWMCASTFQTSAGTVFPPQQS